MSLEEKKVTIPDVSSSISERLKELHRLLVGETKVKVKTSESGVALKSASEELRKAFDMYGPAKSGRLGGLRSVLDDAFDGQTLFGLTMRSLKPLLDMLLMEVSFQHEITGVTSVVLVTKRDVYGGPPYQQIFQFPSHILDTKKGYHDTLTSIFVELGRFYDKFLG